MPLATTTRPDRITILRRGKAELARLMVRREVLPEVEKAYEGQIVGEYPPTVSKERLGIAMTGGRSRLREGTDGLLHVPA